MSTAALINMIIVLTLVVGGFGFFLWLALSRDSSRSGNHADDA